MKLLLSTVDFSLALLNRKRPSRSSLCQFSCTRSGLSSVPRHLSSKKTIYKIDQSNLRGKKFLKKEQLFTTVRMNFIESILGHMQHFHVRPEFLNECLDDSLCRSCWRDTDTFGGNFLSSILEIIAHNSVEFIILWTKFGMWNRSLNKYNKTFLKYLIGFTEREKVQAIGVPLSNDVTEGFAFPPLSLLHLPVVSQQVQLLLWQASALAAVTATTPVPPFLFPDFVESIPKRWRV